MRTVALIDMDCFYAQVEQRDAPELWGKPVAVVQYAREGAYGGIIALSYEAKWAGVKRGMFIPEAKEKCPELQIAYVPQGEHTDKADIQKYRDASAEIFNILNKVDPRIVVERASVDEAFMDMSRFCNETYNDIDNKDEYLDKLVSDVANIFPTTHVADGRDENHEKSDNFSYEREVNLIDWLSNNCRADPLQFKLAIASLTVEKIRADINKATQFFCSAGIGNNKTLAKLVCARHKPRQQTVVPMTNVPAIYRFTPIRDVRMLGGKLGKALCTRFNISTMAELATFNYERLCEVFPNQGKWLWNLAKGQDDEPVKPRNTQTSIAVGKNFPGKNALTTINEASKWVDGLSKELAKRLVADRAKNKRTAENLVISLCNPGLQTKTLKLNTYNPRIIYNMAWSFTKNYNKAPPLSPKWEPPIIQYALSASKFAEGVSTESKSIMDWVADSIPLDKNDDDDVLLIDVENQPSTSSGRRGADQEVNIEDRKSTEPVEVKTDEDGWQIFDPANLVDASGPVIPETIQVGELQIAKDVFNELPDFIRAELKQQQRMLEARKNNERQPDRSKPSTSKISKSKKRPAKQLPVQPPPKKTLDAFFKK